jgi:hypothetical protein
MVATLAMSFALTVPSAAFAESLRAGAARVDISPPPGMLPIKGLGNFVGVHDPIFVRALELDNGKDRVLLLTLDAITLFGTDELRDGIARDLKMPRENILMSATHDHNTPIMVNVPGARSYFDLVRKGVLDAARRAHEQLRPARIGYRTGKAYINANRDERIGDRYTMGYDPEGPSDKTVAVVTVTDNAGKPIAVYANYAVHGVVMFFSMTKDGANEITGDLPGATSRYVEDALGDGVVALWSGGAAGDQNPIFMSAHRGRDGGIEDYKEAGWALLDAQASRLGQEIVRVSRQTSNTVDQATFGVRTGSLSCPGQKPREGAAPVPPEESWGTVKKDMVDAEPVKIPLSVMTIGDIAFAGIGGELFSEIGMKVKAMSPFDRTIVVTNASESVGYIPSERGYALPSEKALGNRIKPGCAEAGIPATIRDLASQLVPRARTAK